jgi:chorismate synthase
MSSVEIATSPALACTYRDLRTIDDCAAVVELEREIWGPDYDEAVPAAILKVTANRGGILIGAFEPGDRLVGFVYSLPSIARGRNAQWSHKLGVAPRCRSGGVGHHLKLQQRERAMRQGVDLIEWTFDPLNAVNAHLNIAKLGVVVDQYEPDFYGRTTVPVRFRGMPTDRFIGTWRLRDPRVDARIAIYGAGGERSLDPAVRSNAMADAVAVVTTARPARWMECRDVILDADAPAVRVDIPIDYPEMELQAPQCAGTWRLQTREVFRTYFARGYRAVDFLLDRRQGTGSYVLVTAAKRVVN